MSAGKIIGAIVAVVLLLLVLAGILAYRFVEHRIFSELESGSYGLTLDYSSKSGNLFMGYKLAGVKLTSNAGGEGTVATSFSTPGLELHWKLRYFHFTDISWDEAVLTLDFPEGDTEEIQIAAGILENAGNGWLESENEIQIGPDSWNGTADIRLKADGTEVDCSVTIDNLPGQILHNAGTIPEGFNVPREVILEMTITGPVRNIQTSGSVANPYTRQKFNF